jgi:hypothetical protein
MPLMRDVAASSVAMAALALVWAPARPRLALGVVGGGVLAVLAVWAIRGAVHQATMVGESGEIRPNSRLFQLVKFFTRHVILGLAAYGMMLRLRLDPVGMLMGVSALWVATIVELVRLRRR